MKQVEIQSRITTSITKKETSMQTLRSFIERHALVTFFTLTYLISFGLFLTWDWANDDSIPWFTFGPMLAALILTALAGGWSALKALLGRLVQWRVGWRWYAVAFGLPVVLALGAVGLTTLSGLPAPTAAQWASWPSLFLAFPIRLFFSGPFGEELGWRGFALPRLQANYSPLKASLILGVLGAIWHLPLMLIGQNQWPDIVLIIAAYLLITWIYNRTNGSVLLVLLFHAATNTIGGGFLGRIYTGADAMQLSIWHTLVWCVAALIVVVATRANLGRKPTGQAQPAPVGRPLAAQ
jgi:membrane protease YdiL (CAAX protease family)